MFIDTFQFCNDKVNVIFTGANYFFFNHFFGIVSIAERDYNKTDATEGKTFFTLFFGNSQPSDSYNKGIAEKAKEYINKKESSFKETVVTFKEVEKDLNLCYLDIQAKER